jgi:hypothetical protein
MKIDLKSALCGLVIGVLAILAIGATNASNDLGRYRLVGTTSYAMIIDSQTGRVWNAKFLTLNEFKATDGDFYSVKVDK